MLFLWKVLIFQKIFILHYCEMERGRTWLILLEQKLKGLRTLHKGETMQKVAKWYGSSRAVLVTGTGKWRN